MSVDLNDNNNPNNSRNERLAGNCSVCKDLLANLGRFLDVLETARRSSVSDWLTVDEISTELKISKSVIYRLIRNGELEAVDLVDTNRKIAQRGHYRVQRSSLNNYLEARKVKPLPEEPRHVARTRRFPKVKNHLGL